MEWFRDHYIGGLDASVPDDPRFAPLKGELAGLPPAMVVTCEFDPLRDEGDAYAQALADAGVDVRHLQCRGQMHTSIPSVDVLVSPTEIRAEIAGELARMLRVEQAAAV